MMKLSILRRGLLIVALLGGLAAPVAGQVAAQTPSPTPAPASGKLRSFPSAEAAADALTDAIRRDDDAAMAAILGDDWRDMVPTNAEDEEKLRSKFLSAWDENHKVIARDNTRAAVEVGSSGWFLPVPIVKDGAGWRYDIEAGRKEIVARRIGRNELATIQTLLAVVDAQREYASLDPMKAGVPQYARRLLSSPGKKDGLYWEVAPGEPQSPLGPAVAKAQAQMQARGEPGEGYYGYRFRLLYGQGPAAIHGARDYLMKGRLIGGFAVIAWPVSYGETGVATFIVNHRGDVYEQDLGPDTAKRAAAIALFNPENGWEKADMAPP
jgi:hypothetical protein